MFNKKIIIYIIIAFVITWGSWFAVSLFQTGDTIPQPLFPLFVFGGFGPVISAFIVKRFMCDKSDFKEFLRQTILVRVHIFWYLFVFIMPLILIFTPWLINFMITGKNELVITQPLNMIVVLIPVMVIGGGFEEFGWRGFLLPELLKKYSIVVSTIFVSIIWAIWHVPLWFIVGVSQYGTSFIEFTITATALSILFTMLYIKDKSIFMAILFHSMINVYLSTFTTPYTQTLPILVNVTTKFLIAILVFVVFLIYYKKNKSKSENILLIKA